MAIKEPPLTIGIKEEYLLIDKETRDLANDPPAEMIAACNARLSGQISPEFLRAQLEVETHVCKTVGEARAEIARLRRVVSEIAAPYGIGLIASATHPFAQWDEQLHTDQDRYNELAIELQAVVRRMLVCGMHVHVGVDDDDLRIDLMNQVSYFLPHLLALSTSSPFWRGDNTGLKSFRLSVFNGMPRSGLPDRVDSGAEWDRLIAQMVQVGMIEDATKLWWDVRPSGRYPTVEMRIADVCTRLDDGITVAALYVCLLSMLYRLRKSNQRWRLYPRVLIDGNRWLAQRHGVGGELVDFGLGQKVPYADLLDEIIDLVREDAERLDCVAEVENAREIVRRGTSADRQIKTYQEALDGGADEREALVSVVDMLMVETLIGTDGA